MSDLQDPGRGYAQTLLVAEVGEDVMRKAAVTVRRMVPDEAEQAEVLAMLALDQVDR